jgi:hypothetical protein
MTAANGEFYNKCGLFFTDTDVTVVQLGDVDEDMADGNYGTWARVVESVNTNRISLVDYSIKDIPDFTTAQPIKTIAYDDIKSVDIHKATDTGNDSNYDQYEIVFSMGIMNAISYLIPAATLDEAMQLLNKTPLSSKIKQNNP